jgi:hypothetical protein
MGIYGLKENPQNNNKALIRIAALPLLLLIGQRMKLLKSRRTNNQVGKLFKIESVQKF